MWFTPQKYDRKRSTIHEDGDFKIMINYVQILFKLLAQEIIPVVSWCSY